MDNLGKSIKAKRMACKIKQQELAYRCDIEKPNIVRNRKRKNKSY